MAAKLSPQTVVTKVFFFLAKSSNKAPFFFFPFFGKEKKSNKRKKNFSKSHKSNLSSFFLFVPPRYMSFEREMPFPIQACSIEPKKKFRSTNQKFPLTVLYLFSQPPFSLNDLLSDDSDSLSAYFFCCVGSLLQVVSPERDPTLFGPSFLLFCVSSLLRVVSPKRDLTQFFCCFFCRSKSLERLFCFCLFCSHLRFLVSWRDRYNKTPSLPKFLPSPYVVFNPPLRNLVFCVLECDGRIFGFLLCLCFWVFGFFVRFLCHLSLLQVVSPERDR
jgi:hypothetical protein